MWGPFFLWILLILLPCSGLEWTSVLFLCHTAIDGDYTGASSIRHLGSRWHPDFCPTSTAGHANSSGSCLILQSSSTIMSSSKCTGVKALMVQLISPLRYTAAAILNSVYDYDPASRKDELVDMVANTLDIIIPALRPDVAIIVGAFPLCGSVTFPLFDHEMNVFQVLYLPAWFPGMSFKKQMAVSREYSKQYLERPFEYSLQKVVMINLIFCAHVE